MRAEREPHKILECGDKNILVKDVMSVYFPGSLEDAHYPDVKLLSTNNWFSLSGGAHYTLDHDDPYWGPSHAFVYKRIEPRIQHQPTTAIGGKILNVTYERRSIFQTKRWQTEVFNIPVTDEGMHDIPTLISSTENSVLQQKYDEVRCTGALAIPLDVFDCMMFLLNEGGFLITSKDAILKKDGWTQKVEKYAKDVGVHTPRAYPEYIFIQKPEDSGCECKLFYE